MKKPNDHAEPTKVDGMRCKTRFVICSNSGMRCKTRFVICSNSGMRCKTRFVITTVIIAIHTIGTDHVFYLFTLCFHLCMTEFADSGSDSSSDMSLHCVSIFVCQSLLTVAVTLVQT